MNNRTLGALSDAMIGRADIEGSKSDVAMNAWPPQASYPCGNFSDTSRRNLSGGEDRLAARLRYPRLLNVGIKPAFAHLLDSRFPSSVSRP